MDALGHILKSAAFIAVDSVWQLKAIHETSYGYLLCNQIRSRKNKRTVFLKLIGIDKNLNVLFNRNHLIVDSATTAFELSTDIDELNGRFVSLSTVYYQSINIPYQLFFKTMQYDENGVVQKINIYYPTAKNQGYIGFFQYLKFKNDGNLSALVYYSDETHQLFLDSNLKVTNDTVFKDANGMQPLLSLEADYARIISDSSLLYFNFIPDSSGFSVPCVSIFKRNGIALEAV